MPLLPSALPDDTPTRTHADLARRANLGFMGLMLGLFFIASIALIRIALSLNEHEQKYNQIDARRTLDHRQEITTTVLTDYAFWDDAYDYTHNRIDLDWVYERNNIGPSLFDIYKIEGVFVIGPDNATRYGLIEGQLSSQQALNWIKGDLPTLLAQARQRAAHDTYAHGYFLANGQPAVVSAAVIKPTELAPGQSIDQLSLLLFVDILTPPKLASMAEGLRLLELQAALLESAPTNETARQNVPVIFAGDAGPPLALYWQPEKPGDALLHVLLPLLILTALIFAFLAWRLQCRAVAAARLIDVSHEKLKKNEEALRHNKARFKDIAEASSDWIWETDTQRTVTYLSERFTTVTGHPVSAWLGRSLDELLIHNAEAFETLATTSAGHCSRVPLQCQLIDRQQRQRRCTLSVRTITRDGLLYGYRGTVCDVTEELEAKARVAHLSQHDVLTGLPNRPHMHTYLQRCLDAGPTLKKPCLVLSLDLDRFKSVNDTLGPVAGDKVLMEVAFRLQKAVGAEGFVARLGADEFILILQGPGQPCAIASLCEHLLALLGKPFLFGEHEITLSASIGLAQAPLDSLQANELLRYADIALSEAKTQGRNVWQVYSYEMNERIVQRRQTELDLKQALSSDELRLEFQPRYNLHGTDRRLAGAEVLVRWAHPSRGYLSPAHFITIAEETGLIVPLSDWVLLHGCREAASWDNGLFISVNLSPVEFHRGDLVKRVQTALDLTGLPAERLELEITESVMIEDAQGALVLMGELKALGIRLAMDDFGTGYSSLSYLRTYPFDGLKIDRSFIADLNGSADDQAIIEAIVGLGRALSLTITAEGVETQAQLDELIRVGCHQVQGYYLGRPMPVEALKKQMTTLTASAEESGTPVFAGEGI
ncbi:PAS domain S-box-containing protein/diguanylate cyclase (GGDEF)-like protein [Pseudomonas duriflava]|uniref:PAS domain S-box-containing protein/diguanylate cyclase (GGDEF)-like protein n=1 Tax=Pseudomonas duriflava TaxID=459528 RepID=A0A562QIG2_9PSED|nr:EAL domain-containing protein [Pseudomonas duriflava]TWI56542.1 PAS domain S-box-containing protein/diguanylate cyclase (GGDEF)-like protein [Pseudomonas duriflava]